MDTSEKITARMKALGIKGTDVTSKIGASSGSVSQWKKGTSDPSGKYLLPLAKMLKCDPEWLLSEDDEPAAGFDDTIEQGPPIKGVIP